MLDSLPPWARHLLFILAPIVLGWVASDVIPALENRNPLVAALVGALVTALAAWLTPVTRQYGVGSAKHAA